MENDVFLDEGSKALTAAEKDLLSGEVSKLLDELSKRKLPQEYTYLDAVARQGSHVGLPTTRP